MNYLEGYNIPAKEHQINSSEKTSNSIMYIMKLKQKYIWTTKKE